MLQEDRGGQLVISLTEVKGTDTLAKSDNDTLEFFQEILESCRYLCRRMGKCSKKHDLCGKHGGSDPIPLEVFCETCDADVMKSRLEQSVRLVEVGQWITELTHDIKHPAAAISTAAQTLQRLPDMEGPARRLATIIREEITHLNKLVDGLLYMTKPRQPRSTPYDVNEIVDRIMPVIRKRISDNGSNITVKRKSSREQAVALIDDDQIEEVFMNLAANALEAMADGGTLSISINAGKDDVQVAFTDTGIGISKRDQDLIFNPFYSTKAGGIGLGLVIVKRIAEAHSGYVDVVSKASAGTTFTVTLPKPTK